MRFSLILVLLLALATAATPAAAAERKIPPAKAEIQFAGTPGTVTFKHEVHATKYGVTCETCHHTLTAAEALPKPCSACHLKTASPKMPALQNAVHQKCWGCHKAEAAKGKKAPLQTQCNGCHVRKA
jgi:predicted CXXCH cytochrome family protein